MTHVAIVYHSGFGHTQALAEAVARGVETVAGTNVSLVPVAEAEARHAELDSADAIIFGSPTYMGGVSAEFAKFKDWTSKRWMEGAWRNKLAAGFTSSASWNGDKHNTLYQLLTLALQHGMVWVGLGLPPGYNHSKGSVEDLSIAWERLSVRWRRPMPTRVSRASPPPISAPWRRSASVSPTQPVAGAKSRWHKPRRDGPLHPAGAIPAGCLLLCIASRAMKSFPPPPMSW